MTSILKVDNIQTQSGKTIISETSNVVTVGQAGDTVVNSGNTTIKGDGSSADGKIILNCSQNSHGVGIQAPPHSAGATYTLTLPTSAGSNAQVLTTNGSGVLAWANDQIVTGFPTITSCTPGTIQPSTATTVVIAGTNFLTGLNLEAVNSSTGAVLNAASFTIDSTTQITASFNIATNGNYFIRIENTTGLAGRSSSALLTVSPGPVFSTATALGTVSGGTTGTIFTIVASEAAGGAITYSSLSSILTQTSAGGMNCTLNTSTGVISSSGSGFDLNDGSATNFSFIIRATDPQNQTTDRTFTCSSLYYTGSTGGGQFN